MSVLSIKNNALPSLTGADFTYGFLVLFDTFNWTTVYL